MFRRRHNHNGHHRIIELEVGDEGMDLLEEASEELRIPIETVIARALEVDGFFRQQAKDGNQIVIRDTRGHEHPVVFA